MEHKCRTKPRNFKEFIRSSWFLRPLLGVTIGGIAGFLYFHFAGCPTGSCPITSNPYMSITWGGVLGFLLVSSPCSNGRC